MQPRRFVISMLLWLDVQLFSESSPLLLFLTDNVRRIVGRVISGRDKTQRQQPFLYIWVLNILSDFGIQRRNRRFGRARRRNNGEKSVHNHARHNFLQSRQIRQTGKPLVGRDGKSAHFSCLYDSRCGRY